MGRFKDHNWNVGGNEATRENPQWEGAQLAVLMDMRDELKGIRTGIEAIRHFFHMLDVAGIKVIAREQVRRHEKIRSLRLAAAKRKKAAA